ncbi:hypothetical protein M885DRAFT_511995 [Pelagophyceae sp. CCMP2097]|nr:hypothetical protein M885DRAFT_511995 [Pelagophyceae sp. CCMP2097]|mmetsp:Transcript_17924/g.63718  ORF Transcript_17924/g.63718 Transcript_17924/m.63718 type:complete len:203 (+) Transcript_17924:376-984(+)
MASNSNGVSNPAAAKPHAKLARCWGLNVRSLFCASSAKTSKSAGASKPWMRAAPKAVLAMWRASHFRESAPALSATRLSSFFKVRSAFASVLKLFNSYFRPRWWNAVARFDAVKPAPWWSKRSRMWPARGALMSCSLRNVESALEGPAIFTISAKPSKTCPSISRTAAEMSSALLSSTATARKPKPKNSDVRCLTCTEAVRT